jgi:hypothetical protein
VYPCGTSVAPSDAAQHHRAERRPMANKDQIKSKAKNNKPKLTAKQKKEKKQKKAAEGKSRYDA